jgi:hypothetical protein
MNAPLRKFRTFDFLVVRQVTPSNPANAVRGPKYVVKKGKTPVWSRETPKRCRSRAQVESQMGWNEIAKLTENAGLGCR